MSYLLAKILPFTMVLAAAPAAATNGPGVTTPAFITTIIAWAAGVGGGIVAIFLIIALVKDGIELGKGSGNASIFKILGKALFLILIIGLIFLALNYQSLGNTARNIGQKAIDITGNEVTNMLP